VSKSASIHGEWSSHLAFIMAATGSAVGLGNIWKFPHITGTYGGGAFVLLYLLCIFLLGFPLMMAEITLGRRGRHSPINSLRHLTAEANSSRLWMFIGWMGVCTGILILSFYSVVAGWSLAYIEKLISGQFSDLANLPSEALSELAQNAFGELVSNPYQLILWHSVFMLGTTWVAASGVRGGLERAINYLMPLLFLLLLGLVAYAFTTPAFMQGVTFLFHVDFNALFYPHCTPEACEFSGEALLAALGQAFFTLSLGMGCIMAYGAYVPADASITRTTFVIVLADTAVALLAGIAIFPIVFSNGLEPSQGVGLVFHSLPLAFGQMSGGLVFGVLFFLLLSVAAWTSAFSLIEPAIAWLVEATRLNRRQATWLLGGLIWLLGLLTVFSFNIWQHVTPLSMFDMFKDKTIFDLLDFFTTNLMLPLGGLLIALFAGWVMYREHSAAELQLDANGTAYQTWQVLTRLVVPAGLLIVLAKVLPTVGVLVALFTAWVIFREHKAEAGRIDSNSSAYRTWRVLIFTLVPLGLVLMVLNAVGVFA